MTQPVAPSHPDARIWMDGKLIPWEQATVHVLTHSLHYGTGVFEGVRAFAADRGSAIFRLQEHTDRMFRSAESIGMEIPYHKDEINQACIDTVRDSGLEAAYIRPICFYGANSLGLHAKNLFVHVVIAAWKWGNYLGSDSTRKGIRLYTSHIVRDRVNQPLNHSKICGNYVYSTAAVREAKEAGYDEALLLERDGRISEGSGENLFVVQDGILQTPQSGSALEGITRSTIMELAGEEGIKVEETRLERDALLTCDEAFFTGTAADVTPIRELDGHALGNGGCGPITARLRDRYHELVHGRDARHEDWLTYVR